jgi:hypothetical protein
MIGGKMVKEGFFSNIVQESVQFGKFRAKTPLFFKDATIMGGYFFADYSAVREQVPETFLPIKLPFNRAIVGIFCMDYKYCDIGPYREFSVSVAIYPQAGSVSKKLNSITALLNREFHSHVLQLPVNTEISVAGGREIFNFPKILTEIDIRDTGTHKVFTLRDPEDLSMIIEIECLNLKTTHHPQNKKLKELTMYTYQDEQNLTKRGIFKINQIEHGLSLLWPSISLRFGDHDLAREIKKLKLGKQLLTIFNPHFEGMMSLEEGVNL